MPEKDTQETSYQKGFNEGYIISKHMPELADKLAQVKSTEPRMEGFRDGREEFMQEKSYRPKWMTRDISSPQPPKDKDKDIDRS